MPSNFKPKKKSNESLSISNNTSQSKQPIIELKEPHKSPANVKKRRLR